MSTALPVDCVSDTAFLLAWLRAVESDRPDAHFHDACAGSLAGDRGTSLVRRLPGGSASAAGCIVRTCLIDELLMELVRERQIDAVLNLGAGLDTRPYRLDLPPSMHWIEVDSSAVLDYKRATLSDGAPRCRVEQVGLDVTDGRALRDLLQKVGARGNSTAVITEGLIIYLEEDEVQALATELHAHPNIRWWVTDLASAHALHMSEQILHGGARLTDVRLKFAPTQGAEFFHPLGWEVRSAHSCIEAGRRLRRWLVPEEILERLSPEHLAIIQQLSQVVKMQSG
jgi:methyltransferase (TIGR00027 family)